MVAPDGSVRVYTYDAQGNLVAARDLATGATNRYGYDDAHQLITAVSAAGAGTAVAYAPGVPPDTFPVTANLGTATAFDGHVTAGALAAGATDYFAFSVRASEIKPTAVGELLVRVSVRATSGTLQPALPQIPGLTPRSTFVGAGHADALFAISRESLYHVAVSGAAGTAGNFELQVSVAGDINADGVIDGTDSQLMAAAQGSHTGDAGYVFAADLDGNGVINATDTQVLARNYGFLANRGPTVNPAIPAVTTHVGLAVRAALDNIVTDPDGDRVVYQLTGVLGGTAVLSPTGAYVQFTPTPGYSGAAGFYVTADDGFSASAPE
jgi:YD repeat-containing protein